MVEAAVGAATGASAESLALLAANGVEPVYGAFVARASSSVLTETSVGGTVCCILLGSACIVSAAVEVSGILAFAPAPWAGSAPLGPFAFSAGVFVRLLASEDAAAARLLLRCCSSAWASGLEE